MAEYYSDCGWFPFGWNKTKAENVGVCGNATTLTNGRCELVENAMIPLVNEIFKHYAYTYAADVGKYGSTTLAHHKHNTCSLLTPDQCDMVPGCVMHEGLRMDEKGAAGCASVGFAEFVRTANILIPDALEDSALNDLKNLIRATRSANDSTPEYEQLAQRKIFAFCSEVAAALPQDPSYHNICDLETCAFPDMCNDTNVTKEEIQSALDMYS